MPTMRSVESKPRVELGLGADLVAKRGSGGLGGAVAGRHVARERAQAAVGSGGERLLLRVGLKVEPGLVVRTVVEPAAPRV